MSLNIKNPICLVQNKVKKVVVDNVNMTIDVYTSEVPSEENKTFNVIIGSAYLTSGGSDTLTFTLPNDLTLGVSTFDDYFNTNRYEWVGVGDFPCYLYLDGYYVCLDVTIYGIVYSLPIRTLNNSSYVTTDTIIEGNFNFPYSTGGGGD